MAKTPCSSCDGICCRSYSVELTIFDIRRLILGHKIQLEEFCETIASWEGRCFITPSVIMGKNVNFILRRSEDDACLFFRGGTEGCGVYEYRPRSCVVYPFYFVGKLGSPLERRNIPCPMSWIGKVDSADTTAELTIFNHEVQIHNRLVYALNTENSGRDGLARYLYRFLEMLELLRT